MLPFFADFKAFSLTLLVLLMLPSAAQNPVNNQQDVFKKTEYYLSFPSGQAEIILRDKQGISVDYLDPKRQRLFVYANQEGFQTIKGSGTSFRFERAPGYQFEKNDYNMLNNIDVTQIDQWDFYPTYEAYEEMMEQFEQVFPDLCQKLEVKTLASGRKLIFARITSNVEVEGKKPGFMYTSTMHGDETTGFNLSLRLIHYLLNNYGTDDEVTHLLDNLEIWICPLENPDGTYTNDNSTVYGATRYNSNGIDLNRNYPAIIGSPQGTLQEESEGMIEVMNGHHFIMSANIHGGIECVNYPWDSWTSDEKKHADHDWWNLVMHEYADTARFFSPSNYMDPQGSSFFNGVTHGGDWYVVYGSRQDYANYFEQQREFTLEISNTKLLPTALLPDHWDYNFRSMINYMKQSLYGIQGRVVDVNSQEPIRAEVVLIGHDKDNSQVYSSAATGRFYRPVLAGEYTVRVTADGYPHKIINNVLVENYSSIFLDVKLGEPVNVAELNRQDHQMLHPNPADGILWVNPKSPVTVVETLHIYDLQGKLVFETSGKLSGSIDISHLPDATYVVKMTTPEGNITEKLLKR
ncbi:MAG: M14 family zinc carboxypeptidase [Bacteroidales bacterium]